MFSIVQCTVFLNQILSTYKNINFGLISHLEPRKYELDQVRLQPEIIGSHMYVRVYCTVRTGNILCFLVISMQLFIVFTQPYATFCMGMPILRKGLQYLDILWQAIPLGTLQVLAFFSALEAPENSSKIWCIFQTFFSDTRYVPIVVLHTCLYMAFFTFAGFSRRGRKRRAPGARRTTCKLSCV